MRDILETLLTIGVGVVALLFIIVIFWYGMKFIVFSILAVVMIFICWGLGMVVTPWLGFKR